MILSPANICQDRFPYHIVAKIAIRFINESVNHNNSDTKFLQMHSQIVIFIIRAREQVEEAQTFLRGGIQTHTGPHRSCPIAPGDTLCGMHVFRFTSTSGRLQGLVAHITFSYPPTW